MGYKKYYDIIQKRVSYLKEEFGFKGPLHFTDFTNLKKILQKGYLESRYDCERDGINFLDGANHEVLNRAPDHVEHCVRFYYRGKTPTLYDNEGIKLSEFVDQVHIPIPVYLLFDEELLYLDSTEFSDGNATISQISSSPAFFWNIDWNAVFHDKSISPGERNYIVNKRHAELLSKEPVSLKYLKNIIFRCEADRKRAINTIGNDDRYLVDISLFSDKNFHEPQQEWQRNNFIKDYKLVFEFDKNGSKSAIILFVKYQKNWRGFKTGIIIRDKYGKRIQDFKKEIFYIGKDGQVPYQSINGSEVKKYRLSGYNNWYKLEVELNGFTCIEEFLDTYDIKLCNINISHNWFKKILKLQFIYKNNCYLKYDNRIEICDSKGAILYRYNNLFKHDSEKLEQNMELDNFSKDWYRLKYYIGDALCLNKMIKSN